MASRWIAAFLVACLPLATRAGTFEEEVAAAVKPFGPDAVVEVALHDFATGQARLIRADEPIHPASTMKIPVMIEAYRRAEAGDLRLDDELEVVNSFASLVDGSPYALDPADDSETTLYDRVGGKATVRELVFLMVTESSNLATNILVEKLGAKAVTDLMAKLGAPDLKVLRGVQDGKAYEAGLNNVGTARGTMTILRRLAEGTAVSKSADAAMMDVLRAQKFNDGIPAGLPEGTPVAHKTGSITNVYHDAAVVEPPGRAPFVLVVMTRGLGPQPAARALAADVARIAYRHVRNP
ncbi:serine hydrolase [Paludisphaera sp.]|uniref:serine hydrolase n=1 Tax=Paludisphaera sp. TaxID=2017432 RepID=UPI00301C7145